ncbi:MAG: DJ-1/PfpI family protein [Desulfobacterales bacterium]|nr:DJ-1/PfpI family protein [Desulfobacterales bacterium]
MKTIGIYLFDNVEVLDFAGPFEVFSTAQRLRAMMNTDPTNRLFNVVTIAEKKEEIVVRGGLQVIPMYSIEYHPNLDVLIIPGGVVEAEINKAQIISWIISTAGRTDIVASVCTGVFLLAKAGLLEGMTVTTHWDDIADFRETFPNINIKEGVRWVDENHILTSAGISAGIDMSLHLVDRLAGREHALKTARQMEYEWSNF